MAQNASIEVVALVATTNIIDTSFAVAIKGAEVFTVGFGSGFNREDPTTQINRIWYGIRKSDSIGEALKFIGAQHNQNDWDYDEGFVDTQWEKFDPRYEDRIFGIDSEAVSIVKQIVEDFA